MYLLQYLKNKAASVIMFVTILLTALIPNMVFAVSTYTSSVSTATVGTGITPTITYGYSPQQTWASGDTLTIDLPANFPAWSSVTFTAEFDQDSTNNGVNETAITSGGSNGQYSISGRTLTIKWDGTWSLTPGSSQVRVVVTAGMIPQYSGSSSTITFGGATANGGDTNPSGTATINVSAAAANPSLALAGNSVVGGTGNSTLTITTPVDLATGGKIIFTAPSNLFVGLVAFGSHTFSGGGTFSSCSASGQVITCTASGTITAGTATIVMSGIKARYVASGQTLSSISVTDGTNTEASASSGSVTNTTAGDAAASLSLAGNSAVGGSGNATLTLTTEGLQTGSKVIFTAPSNLDVSGVTWVSQSIDGGAGTFSCVAVGQVVTCTSATASITGGTGNIVMSGITAKYAATGQLLTSLSIQDSSSNTAFSGTTNNAVTDTTAATSLTSTFDASAVSTVGDATGQVTESITFPVALVAGDTIKLTFPANYDIASIPTGASKNYTLDNTVTVAVSGQTITLTLEGTEAAGADTISFPANTITPRFAATGQTVAVLIEKAAGQDVVAASTDTGVSKSIDNTSSADAAATITLATPAVAATQNTSLAFTLPLTLAVSDRVTFTLPSNITANSVAAVSDTFSGGDFSCTNSGNAVTCTSGGAITGSGTIVISGISGLYEASGASVSDFVVQDASNSYADIAGDASVAVTDTTAAAASATLTLGSNYIVGTSGDTTLHITIPVALSTGAEILFTAPTNLDVSGVAYKASSQTFGGGGSLTCTASGQDVTCTASGTISAGTAQFDMTGITAISPAVDQVITTIRVKDASANVQASGTSGAVTPDTTDVVDAAASLDLGGNSIVGATGNTTLHITVPTTLAIGAKVLFTAPSNLDVSLTASSTSHTFSGSGTFTCAAVSSTRVVTCTVGDATVGTGAHTIVIAGIVSKYVASSQTISAVAVKSAGNTDIATDDSGVVTDTTAADAAASLALGTNAVVGTAGNTTLSITLPQDLASGATVVFTAPADLDVSLTASSTSKTFTGAGSFICAAVSATRVVTCTADGAVAAGTGTIVLGGIKATYEKSGLTVSSVTVADASARTQATDASGTVTATTVGNLSGPAITLQTNFITASGNATIAFTAVTPISNNGVIRVVFPSGFDLSGSVGQTATNKIGVDGTWTASVSGQTLILTQSGGSATAAGAKSLTITGIKNPNTNGTFTGASITTRTSSAEQIETGAVSGLLIVQSSLGTNTVITTTAPSASAPSSGSSAPVSAVPVPTSAPIPTAPAAPTIAAPQAPSFGVSTEVLHALTSGVFDPKLAQQAVPSIAAELQVAPPAIPPTVKPVCDPESLVKIPNNPAVYYCGADGKRYVFPSSNVYKTWYSDFSTVKTITGDQLATLPIGGSVKYHAGVKMLKLRTDPRVYAIAPGGLLRWVTSEAVATRVYGQNWNKQIEDVSEAFISNYSIGEPLR